MKQTLELRMSRDLAFRLGAVEPETVKEHRALRDAGHLLVRDMRTRWAMFWPWQLNTAEEIGARSSD